MKKLFKFIVWALMTVFSIFKVYSQADVAGGLGHVWVSNYWCGWDNTTSHQFDIKNENNQPINFYTNTGAGNFTPLRMTITGGGNVGIGNFTAPNYLLHIHNTSTNSNVFAQFTNGTTGSGSTNGFRIGLNSTNNNPELRGYDSQPMTFFTNNGEKMRITSNGDVGINTATPQRKFDVSAANIQMRLTYDATHYTDISTTSAGNLVLLPTNLQMGVNTSTPGNTLDVNGGIRMNSPATSTSDNFIVLATNGDLLKRNIAASNLVFSCTGGLTTSYVPRISNGNTKEICTGLIWDDGSNVSIGTTSGFLGKLDVWSTANSVNSLYVKATGTSSTGIAAVGKTYGIYSIANGAYAFGGSPMAAVYGTADGTSNSGTGLSGNYGVQGAISAAQSTSDNYGVAGRSEINSSGGTMNNYGVYGVAGSGNNNYGIYGSISGNAGGWAGYFSGQVYSPYGSWTPSDENLKSNITDLTDATDLLNQLSPKSYTFNTDQYPSMNLPIGTQYGVLAQDVQSIFPQFITDAHQPADYNADGTLLHEAVDFKVINYPGFTGLLLASVKELSSKIDDLQSQLDDCCGYGMQLRGDGSSDQTIELKSALSPSLGQSVLNPHSIQSTIPYYVPAESNEAKIIFKDQLGREVNAVHIVGRGQGQLTIMTSQLEDGIYIYSLVVDGKVVDTKKMIKQQ
ncbi:MAG: tail fiber domain-containing protein [Chitinophagales bacterium]